ncbi:MULTISPECIES: PLD nuclease N-terminal domain-containing protein [Bacillaceae]|jgi:bacteriorhodopsin|uniref:PLD nuclease N-terminal domain-containing protein n=1 Tax=Bacillaceae TaxID=186817 RepID=UPI0014576E49|nr:MULTISPECIES: PLD nuclease N-terminal domain-containing protein [Bacillaceae]MEA3318454.1 PLD nuclease N-terminal domain-containing protein [Bacillota bacterium]NLP52652.1 PLDc_N domain-containing protein [Bacillus sp. RO1]UAL47777.1 PLD nuclease N-terminal domain-containing protein [Sutcliffiella horikoshii]
MENINWSLAAPLIVLQLILIITALISLSRQEQTNGPKWAWALIILFITTIGPILYFVIGRKND